jgi:predicted RNase H-like HicB family nuclease
MKKYFAIFKKTAEATEVEFPDLEGCVTFGKDYDEAYNNAVDALAGWMAYADSQFIVEPSTYEQLKSRKGLIVPIPLDTALLESYEEKKRFNVIFSKTILDRLDAFRKKTGLKRSTVLERAAEEFLSKHVKKAA